MRRFLLPALLLLAAPCAALASPSSVQIAVGNSTFDVELTIRQKLVPNGADVVGGQPGHYVLVASARQGGLVDVSAIEGAANCTRVRPRFGVTSPTTDGFSLVAYAAYYGPYPSRLEANVVRKAVLDCVPDAYVRSGVIERY